MAHQELLDGGSLWRITFNDHSRVARADGAPLLSVYRDGVANGTVSVKRVTEAASPVVHRVLLTAESTLDPGGAFEMSLAGTTTRSVSVEASADLLQHVSVAGETDGGEQIFSGVIMQ